MKIQPITFTSQNSIQKYKRPIINTATTGYVSAGCLLGSMVTGLAKGKVAHKSHKIFSGLTLVSTALHIGLVEYNKKQYLASKK